MIRPLEPEADLPAMQLKEDLVGAICEHSLQRYINGKGEWDRKFSRTGKGIDKERKRNLKLARKEGDKYMGHLESYLQKVTERSNSGLDVVDSPRFQKVASGSCIWSWALDDDEHPPPSSIVSRRDTWEARQLAMVADIMPENTMSGNNLWQHLVTFLTATPDKKLKMPAEREHQKPGTGEQTESDWTDVSMPIEVDTKVQTTIEATPLAQTDGTTLPPSQPSDLGSIKTRFQGWYWTRGSLWREKFRVSTFSKTHKRGTSAGSATTPVARTPVSTIAEPRSGLLAE